MDRATGKHSDREQFQRLFENASKGKFDLVLLWSLDRFSREGVLETLNHLQRLSVYGVGYRSFTEQHLDSCGVYKDAALAILAVIAKQERIRLSERVIAGFEKARRAGRIGGRPRLVVNRDKIARLDEEGWTMAEIGAEMGNFRRLCLPDIERPIASIGDCRKRSERLGRSFYEVFLSLLEALETVRRQPCLHRMFTMHRLQGAVAWPARIGGKTEVTVACGRACQYPGGNWPTHSPAPVIADR